MLNLQFMGKTKIKLNGKRLEDQLGAKTIALICILLLNNNKYLSREKIEGYLWPDSDTQAARYNLRYNLWLIKKNIGPDKNNNHFIKVEDRCCHINEEYNFNSDIINIKEFEPSKEDSIVSLLKLKKLFKGEMLGGYYFKNCDELNDLIIFERMRFEQHQVRILKRLVELYELNQDYKSCIRIIIEIHEIEPYDEEMALKALEIYQKYDKPVSAITYYNKFSKTLSNSLGILPSSKVREKYQEIKSNLTSTNINNDSMENLESSTDYISAPGKVLEIFSGCIKGVKYFWIADVIGKLFKNTSLECFNELDKNELFDLSSIQSDILEYLNEQDQLQIDHEREIMSVNIINAFIKLIKCISKKYNLHITISNSSNMDDISINVLDYLKVSNIEGLKFIEK